MIYELSSFWRASAALAIGVGCAAMAGAKPGSNVQALADSVPEAVQQSKVVGLASADQVLHLAIALKPSSPEGLQAFADMVSDPRSPNYRHFMTPEQIGDSFGPAVVDLNNVVAFLKAKGMTITFVSRDRMGVQADTTVAQAQAAFGFKIDNYEGPNPRGKTFAFFANATPVILPSNIVNVVQCVDGIDNYARRTPRTTLTPNLARGLYNTAPSYAAGFTGAGCKIGFSNWDGFKISNAALFISHFGLPTPSGGSTTNIHVVSVQGSNNNTQGQGEGDLDLQMELSAAPLADIYIYDSTGGELATLQREASDNTADILSESYGWSGQSTATLTADHTAHTTMTSHGQTYLCASGDSGTADMSNDPYPDVDPDITNVGGTTATVNTTTGARITEVGWSGSGGGWSTGVFGNPNFNVHPSWQVGTGVPTGRAFRLVPDVALHSQSGNNAAFQIYYQSSLISIAGTSCASPWFASGLATLEQRLVANGQPRRLGRINDMIYAENGRSDVWFDVTSGSNGTLPDGTTGTAGTGWDFVTGFGAPNFDGWYNLLAIQTIAPTAFSMFRGIVNSGNVASLAAIDTNYLNVSPGLTLNSGEAPCQIILNGTAAISAVSNLEFDLTSHADVGTSQEIDVFNWTTNAYVTVDTRSSPTSDTAVHVTIANPNQYIQSGTKAVRARIIYRQTGPTAHFPWNAFVDQSIWKATPA